MALTITLDFNVLRIKPDCHHDVFAAFVENCHVDISHLVLDCQPTIQGMAVFFEGVPWPFDDTQAFMDDFVKQFQKIAQPFTETLH